MPTTPHIVIAAVAGAAVIGGAAYFMETRPSAGGIRSIDFRNTPVDVAETSCADPQLTGAGVTALPLHNGVYKLGQYQFQLAGDVRYGDVSGHTAQSGDEKAVFVGSCANAGTTSQVLFVYGERDGKPQRLAAADLSDSANTLVQSYEVADGAIQVKTYQGTGPVTLTYALLNGKLVNLNPPTQAAQTTAATQSMPPEQVPAQTTEPSAPTDDATANEDSVSFAAFHDQLAPYGQWINHPVWGAVWHPTSVAADFRPYRNGHWENTDEYGTVWVSDYNWGDIAFHYGRWGYDPNYGWLWQPGYVWGPGWVVWREGAGNIGWFPIPPGYYGGTGAFVDDWDGWYGYRALYGGALDAAAFYALWSFVPAYDIYSASIAVNVIPAGVYAGFIGRTVGWTRFGVAHGHIANFAIDGARFRTAFGRPLPVAARHDFLVHHWPIVGVDRGRIIAERTRMTVNHGVVAHHAVYGRTGYAHRTVYPAHEYSRSGNYEHHTVSTHTYSHSPGVYSHAMSEHSRALSGNSRPVTAGGYTHPAVSEYSRPAAGGNMERPAAGGQMERPAGRGYALPAHQPQRQGAHDNNQPGHH